MIKEDNPEQAGRIIRKLDKKLLHQVMRLILNLTAGNETTEKALCEEVLKDMAHLTTIVDNYFIDKVFSQLLHNE